MITRFKSSLNESSSSTVLTNHNRRRRKPRNVPELRDPNSNMANPNIQIPPLNVNNNGAPQGAPQGPNLRPMEEMLQAPFDGVRRAI